MLASESVKLVAESEKVYVLLYEQDSAIVVNRSQKINIYLDYA